MSKILGLFAALAILLYTAAPSFAGKKALDEGDLDRITAAGEPTIIQISGVDVTTTGGDAEFSVSYEDASTDSLVIGSSTDTSPGGQQDLRALVLNNIAGENLIANAINIASTAQGTLGNQSNNITQSWGSVKITDVVTVTESISVEGEDSEGVVEGAGSRGGFCVGICAPKTAIAEADSEAGSLALAAIAYPIWMAADVIIHIEDVDIDGTEDADFSVTVFKGAFTSLAIDSGAQSSLAALVVNNVAGKNLVANAINIAAGNINNQGAANTPFIGQAGQLNTAGQANSIAQYRGTPANAPQPVAIGLVTPAGCGVVNGIAFGGC